MSHCIKISRHSTPIEQSKNLTGRSRTTLQEPRVRSSAASATTPPSPPSIFRRLRHPSPPPDANGACFVVHGHRFMWSPQSYIILWSRSSRRKVEAIASVFLAIRVAVQLLLLLLLVFQFLSSGRYPSPRAGQGTQGDGRSRCRLKSAALPRVRRMRTTRILPPGPYGEALGAIRGALGTCGPVLQSDDPLTEVALLVFPSPIPHFRFLLRSL